MSRYFVIISPCKSAWSFILSNLNHLSPKDDLCQVLLKLAQWIGRRWKCERFTDRRTVNEQQAISKWANKRYHWKKSCFKIWICNYKFTIIYFSFIHLECFPEYYGITCGDECRFPNYGLHCQSKCNCIEVQCHRISGCLYKGTCVICQPSLIHAWKQNILQWLVVNQSTDSTEKR